MHHHSQDFSRRRFRRQHTTIRAFSSLDTMVGGLLDTLGKSSKRMLISLECRYNCDLQTIDRRSRAALTPGAKNWLVQLYGDRLPANFTLGTDLGSLWSSSFGCLASNYRSLQGISSFASASNRPSLTSPLALPRTLRFGKPLRVKRFSPRSTAAFLPCTFISLNISLYQLCDSANG
jgi:hypothetical protein